ncbi:HlyD family type I secretion periplasmic adaptor subunit [Devosia sp. Root635]|uniref:HlyD family type I secretion periplasmic adaptor subunit n=1 Tax=Devosia sp. Root635 TaxID=1736575 RepID=UPI0006F7CEC7|nr:HlyD family type I secretion periplasmic adaptor subunit [Devosia sp. Root635]KRA55365.1 hypothetical protein ASD80_13225 [Devosia sp. Root635]
MLKIMRGPLIAGLIIVALFFGIFGGWAAMAPLSSGAIAPGIVSPDSGRKIIQHLEGGIIRVIHVREGQHVRAGDPLITLESTRAEANFSSSRQQWLRLLVVRARLDAEAAELEAMTLPPQVDGITDPDLLSFIGNQQRQFATEREAQRQMIEISARQVEQLQSEINGLTAQNAGLARQEELVEQQLLDTRNLLEQQLIARSQVTALRRDLVQLQTAIAANRARIAQANQSIEESNLTLLQNQGAFRLQIATEASDTNNRIAVIDGDMTSSNDVLRRTEISSPVDGIVLNMRNQTTSGVVRAGEPIMDVVPIEEDMIVVAHLRPEDLDLVTIGLTAHVTLVPFASRNLLPLNGEVIQIAADSTQDEATRQSYYEIRVRVPASEVARHQGMFMSPGMPADVTVITGARTLLQYLAEPLVRAVRNAFIYD